MLNPNIYARGNALMRRDIEDVLRKFGSVLKWTGNDTLLDIGSGSGDATVDLILPRMSPNSKLVGMDISEKMVDYARQTYCDRHKNVFFEVGDIENNFTEYKEKFDHVTSFYCLHYIRDQRKAFKNIHHLLKPAGDGLILLLVNKAPWDIYKKLYTSPRWSGYMANMYEVISPYHNIDDPVAEVSSHLDPFESDVKLVNSDYTFKDLDEYKEHLIATNPFLHKFNTDKEKEDYVQEIMQHSASLVNADQSVTYSYKYLVVCLRKHISS